MSCGAPKDVEAIQDAQKEAGKALGRTTNSIKDQQHVSGDARKAHRKKMEATLATSEDGFYDAKSMQEMLAPSGIFDGPVYPDTNRHVMYLESLRVTRHAAEARSWYDCPVVLVLRLLEECQKKEKDNDLLAMSGNAVGESEAKKLATAVQGFKQQLGIDLVWLGKHLRSTNGPNYSVQLPLLGECDALRCVQEAERLSKESWKLLKEGKTSLNSSNVEGATGACKKNIANAICEQQGNSAVAEALMRSAKDNYDNSGKPEASSYREIGGEGPAKRRKVMDCVKPALGSLLPRGLQRIPEERNAPDNMCVICMDDPRNIKFSPCNHVACCEECAPHCEMCPLCRERVISSEKVFI